EGIVYACFGFGERGPPQGSRRPVVVTSVRHQESGDPWRFPESELHVLQVLHHGIEQIPRTLNPTPGSVPGQIEQVHEQVAKFVRHSESLFLLRCGFLCCHGDLPGTMSKRLRSSSIPSRNCKV